MKIYFITFFIFLIVVTTATQPINTLLNRMEKHIQQFILKYQTGQTSDAFSIIMSLKVALDHFSQQFDLSIQKPPQYISQSCNQLLSDLIGGAAHINWMENFQHIASNINKIASKCTNSDFKSTNLLNLQGFDNTCALCTVILRVMDNYVVLHKKNYTSFIQNEVCNFFNGTLRPTCQAFIHYTGPIIISQLAQTYSTDKVCLKTGLCKDPKCGILKAAIGKIEQPLKPLQIVPSWQWIIQLFTKHFGDSHLPPLFDLDNDTFSDLSTFRGYNWRGVDCDQFNPNIYPGRKTGNKIIDQDCNGIYGVDDKGQIYQKFFCENTHRLGIAVIGDSAGAHFSIPQKYFNASMIQKGTYKDLLYRIADELDIPHESGYTGHTNTQYLSHSVYKYLRDWNLCNNNDYQNLGVNGGDSGNTFGNMKALKRDPQNDYPLLIFLELIGNDVCSHDLNGMTKPQEFKRNIIRLLTWLDTTVPEGSHLWIFGLAEGSLLYDTLHDAIHPLNVTFQSVYNFLNCLKISPCTTWLNSDDQTRRITTQRAMNLSKIYKQVMNEYKFKNFDIIYQDFPTREILNRRIKQGGSGRQMIQRCDGFHPNGLFHSYLADWIWYKIQTQYSEWIGPKNPHNAQIQKRFNLTVFTDQTNMKQQ